VPRRHGGIESHVFHYVHERVKKRREEERRKLIEIMKRHRELYMKIFMLWDYHTRAMAAYMRYNSWLRVAREFLEEMLYEHSIKRVYDLVERAADFAELLEVLRDFVAGRARPLFVIEHRHFFVIDKTVTVIRDRMLMDLPPEEREAVIEGLIKASTGKYEPVEVLQRYPALRFFLQRYIAYFKKYPCVHKSFALRLTPVTLHFSRYMRSTYYVLRWVKVGDMREDALLRSARSIDLYFLGAMRKPYDDILNTMTYVGSGTGDYNDTVALARDDLRRDFMRAPLRRAILSPHWIKRAMSKVLGKPEMYDNVHHCSVYAILERRPKTSKLYEAEAPRSLLGKRPRRRIKEFTYYAGLRA